MELRHVRAFLVVAEELHFGRSAARLHVVQSAVSQTIQALEEEVGAKLFERTKRRVALTPAGESFVEHARRALEALERGKASARSAGSGESGDLSLAFTLMSALTVLPRAVHAYRERFPRVRLLIRSMTSRDQLAAIEERRCDIGFMPRATAKRGSESERALAAEPLEEAPLAVVVAQGHALARRRAVRLRELSEEPMVFLVQRDEPQVNQAFRQRCAAAGFEPRIAAEVEDVESVLGFVAAGIGVACVPGLVRSLPFPGTTVVDLEPAAPTGIWAVWQRHSLSATATQFLDVLRACSAERARRPRTKA